MEGKGCEWKLSGVKGPCHGNDSFSKYVPSKYVLMSNSSFLTFKVPSNFIEEAKSLCERHFAATFGPRLVRGFNEEILFAVENSQSDEDEGITSLKHVIKNDAPTSFKFVNEEFPLKWLHCEDEIIKYQQNPDNEMCVTLDKFKALLEKKCMVTFKGDELDAMVSFFHDSGLILFPGSVNK